MATLFLVACESAEDRALYECKGAYDRYQRWMQAHQRRPETPTEMEDVLPPDKLDPWGRPYVVEVLEGRAIVWSFGPDKVEGTDDDISYPPE